jgi:Family of unknown function (DUF5318)
MPGSWFDEIEFSGLDTSIPHTQLAFGSQDETGGRTNGGPQRARRVYHHAMSLSGRSFDPKRPPVSTAGPVVDFSLARRSTLEALRGGRLATTDVCDAHPELLRAGKNIGEEVPALCPVCSHESLRWVRYVYGDDLKQNSGRVVYPADWLLELVANYDQFTCYVVEVCTDCAWNHLMRSYVTGRNFTAPPSLRERKQQG